MKREKLIRKINEALDIENEEGFDRGYSDGYDDGWQAGIEARKENVKARLEMHIETCMESNKFREAQFAKDMITFLTWDYDPVEAERKMREEEENSDGFGLIL